MTKKEEPPQVITLGKETRMMPCHLTDEETMKSGEMLAVTSLEIEGEEDRQKNIKDQMKARLSELVSRQTRLARVVSRREEYRDTEVEITLHSGGFVTEVRLDTGEIITNRPARDSEKQLGLNQQKAIDAAKADLTPEEKD